jgi:hypothetical protein
MRRFLKLFAIVTAGLLWFAPTTNAQAQADLAGVFFGNVSGSGTSGNFGVMLRTNGTAIFAMDVLFLIMGGGGSFTAKEVVFLNQSVAVAANGTFSQPNIDGRGTTVSGQFTQSGLTGTIVESGGASASFSGTREPSSGFLVGTGGFYRGPLSGNETINGVPVVSLTGTLSVIAAADGSGYAFAVRQGAGQTKKDGFNVTVATDFSVMGSVGILDYEGTFDPAAKTANGTFSGEINLGGDVFGQSGNWSVSRLEPLPNRPPVAVNDTYRAPGRGLSVSAPEGVLANDSDPDGQPLSALLTLAPPVGVLDLRADGSFEYAPPKGFKGVVTFRYRASDGASQSAEAEVSIDVLPISLGHVLPLLLDD